MSNIHPTALVDAQAELDASVSVGPYAVIGAGVRIGAGTSVGAHTVIEGPTTIGRDNRIRTHAAIGGAPQDMKYRGEPTELHIGDRNTIGEFCTFNRGTVQDAGVTRVGDDNWVMAYVHIAHDVQLGHPLAVHGINAEGLKRRAFTRERIASVRQMHRLLYRDGLTLEKAREAIASLLGTVEGGDADITALLDFLTSSTRGIVR